MRIAVDLATLGLWVQCAAATLIAALFLLLDRPDAPRFHRWWAAAWGCLAVALLSLGLGYRERPPLVLAVFQAFELAFVFAVWRGVRELGGRPTARRSVLVWLAALAAWSVTLTLLAWETAAPGPPRAARLFFAQTVVAAVGYAVAAAAAGRVVVREKGLGPILLAVALGLLAVLVLAEAPAHLVSPDVAPAAAGFLFYATFSEVLLQFLAAFAMLLCRTEAEERRLTAFHSNLASAHRELINTYALLRDESERDPLTDAYNRTAFRRFIRESPAPVTQGCIAVIDMNELKVINDRNGHEIGDRAIQLLADAIRGLFRPEDPLFRWGGDEFLLLLRYTNVAEAKNRLGRLNRLLATSWSGPSPAPQAAWGIEAFWTAEEFPRALKRADSAMYASKRAVASTGAA